MQFEVEQKYRVNDAESLEERLRALGASFQPAIEQADHYFTHPARDFAKSDEALRLRRVGEANFVTYKGPKRPGAAKTRRELEIALPSGEKFESQFSELLEAISFRSVAVVEKRRRVGRVAWEGREVEIALDHVRGLGSFIELELQADEAGIDAAEECLRGLAAHLQLSGGQRRSYLELLLEKK